MKAIRVLAVLLVVAMAGVLTAQDQATGDIREKMEVNLEKMEEMLKHLLLDDRYDLIINDAALITKHAQLIRDLDPSEWAEKMPDQKYFHSYALHLESSAQNLKVVVEEMETERAAGAERSEHLRANAAVFFGQVTAMCVNCHNKFREK